MMKLFIFFHVKERTKRKRPCHGVVLRVADTAGARGNSPACGGLRQSASFLPSVLAMLGPVTKGQTAQLQQFYYM
jgi:hypothetical protein